METTAIDLMREQVRAIYRAATGSELVESESGGEAAALPLDDVALRFADLEAMARSVPGVAERVPPFSFTPLIDLIEDAREWVVEAAVPGVDPDEVSVETSGDVLIVSGIRRGASNGRSYMHAEIPRGPFRRSIQMPQPIERPPRVHVEQGVISVHVPKPTRRSRAPRGARKSGSRRARRE
jgi:HSP20 family protein